MNIKIEMNKLYLFNMTHKNNNLFIN
jgi:hypothetical protein